MHGFVPERTKRPAGAPPARPWRERARRVRRWLLGGLPLLLITLALVTAALAVRVAEPSWLRHVQNLVFDEYQRIDPRPFDPALPVRIVAIDEESLARLGQWPWSRRTIAALVDRLTEMGAAAIALDFVMAEPDRSSPEQIVDMLPEGAARDALAASLEETPRNDFVLAETILEAPVVLGLVLDNRGADDRPTAAAAFAEPKAGFAFAGDDPRDFVPRFSAATAPLPVLSQAAAGLGSINWIPDRDQVVRSVPLVFQLQEGRFVPSLAAEALRVAQGASTFVVRSSNASGQTAFGAGTGVNAIRVGHFQAATDPTGAVRVRFSETTPERLIPAWWVLEGLADRSEVEGRIILIGPTAPSLLDLRSTPVEVAIPGVEIHAQLIEHLVAGERLVRPDWASGLEMVAFVALAVMFALAAAHLSPLVSLLFGVVTLVGAVVASFQLFQERGYLIDPAFPVLASAIVLLAATGWTAVHEQSARRSVRRAFSRYVAPELVERLASDPDRLALGGEVKPMTIMFSDMRSFTTISEGMDAVTLTNFMNDFLTPLTDTILAHGGTIDKYMGDAIMAFWNAPLDDPAHAEHACEAALAMLAALETFNRQNRGRYPEVSIGIGINTGPCCVGNLGSLRRFDYSVIGDDVNVASRLEGQTKHYGPSVILGPQTAEAAAAAGYAILPLDRVRVKGKDLPLDIFGLLGGPSRPVEERLAALAPVVTAMIEAFRAGDRAATEAALAALAKADHPTLRPLAERYRTRLEALPDGRFPDEWDGAVTLTSK